jgi:hypothetical protein
MVYVEQPPSSTDKDLASYLVRAQDQLYNSIASINGYEVVNKLPQVPKENVIYYFKVAVQPAVKTSGFYTYVNKTWIKGTNDDPLDGLSTILKDYVTKVAFNTILTGYVKSVDLTTSLENKQDKATNLINIADLSLIQAFMLTLLESPTLNDFKTALDIHESTELVTSVAGRIGDILLSVLDIGGLGSSATHSHSDYATAAQGELAVTAVQPSVLGSAASHAATDFATPTDVGVVITALGLGSASTHAASDFATAAQGILAASALQSAPVTKVAGRTGEITLSASDISGLSGTVTTVITTAQASSIQVYFTQGGL